MTIEITQDAAVTYRIKPEDRRIIERKDAGGRWKYHNNYKTAAEAKAALVAITRPESPREALEQIRITQIRADGGTQMRAGLNQETVAEYVEVIYGGDKRLLDWPFPPLVLYYDGTEYWLADGFHRLAAFRKALKIDSPSDMNNVDITHTLPAIVHAGDRRAAILHAAGANAAHGLRRSNADKRRAVETLLRDEEWRQWSDAEIGRKCAVNDKTVGNIRRELSSEFPESTVRKTTAGRTIDTANIGPKVKSTPEIPKSKSEIETVPIESKHLADAGFTLQRWGDQWRYAWQRGDATSVSVSYSIFYPHRADVFDAAFAALADTDFDALPAGSDPAAVGTSGQTSKEPATDPDELAAIAIVEAEVVAEDTERAERDAQRASYERVPEPLPFDAWLAAMPTDLSVAEHLAILELAKGSATRLRSMRPALYNPVSNALPTWSQMIIAVEKLLK